MNYYATANHPPTEEYSPIHYSQEEMPRPEAWIKGHYFYPFFRVSGMTYPEWIDSLRKILLRSEVVSPLRLMQGPAGDYFLNLEFAAALATEAEADLIGAMLRILIDDARFNTTDPAYANKMLQTFEALVYDDELDPPLVHLFLEDKLPFDCWLKEQFEKFQPVYERDYSGNTLEALINEAASENSSLLEQIQVHTTDLWLDKSFATKIAMASPTRRGALVRMLLGHTPVSPSEPHREY